jgi:hypothetical protein
MLDFTGSYSNAQRTQTARRGGMAITTGNDCTWQHQPQFRADHVRYALAWIFQTEVHNLVVSRICAHELHQLATAGVGALMPSGFRGHYVVLRGDGQAGMSDFSTGCFQTIESDCAGGLLQKMTIYKYQIPVGV